MKQQSEELLTAVPSSGQLVIKLFHRRGPTEKELNSHLFSAIWNVIKNWDIERTPGEGYAGGTGSDVCEIMDAIKNHIPIIHLPE